MNHRNSLSNPSSVEQEEDRDLVSRAQAGNREALESLVDRHKDAVFGFLLNRLHHYEDARDCAQEAMVKMIKALPQYQPTGSYRAWLFTIVRNEMLNYIKKRDRIATFPLSTIGESNTGIEMISEDETRKAVDDNERTTAVRDCVSQLPEQEREVLEFRLQKDLTFREIAEVLSRPLNTVLSQMRRASQRLKDCLIGKGIESA